MWQIILNQLERTSVTKLAMEQIKELITSGKFQVDEQLPPETELSSMWGVSRNTVREVLITLQAQGYVEIRRGKGAFVINSSDFFERTFMEWFQKNEFRIQELLEVRMSIEPYAAFLAATKITDGEIAELEKVQEDFSVCIKAGRIEDMVSNDEKFHFKIIRASRNELLEFMYGHYCPALRDYRSRVFYPSIAVEGHHQILKALKQRNAERTYEVMMDHIKECKADIDGIAKIIK